MSNLKYIIHYENQVRYCETKSLTETNLRRISEAREKRNELGAKNNPLEQIKQVPEKIPSFMEFIWSLVTKGIV